MGKVVGCRDVKVLLLTIIYFKRDKKTKIKELIATYIHD